VIFSATKSAILAPTKDAPNIIPDSTIHPEDILLLRWGQGCPGALDIHVISQLQQWIMAEAAYTPGHAL